MMSFEKPQKGNPHKFVIKQHFHTAHIISKFYNSSNQIEVKFSGSNQIEPVSKKSKKFCAKRAWDEKSERGIMADIENKFHEEVNNIKPIGTRSHEAISKYFILWRIRHHMATSEIENPNVKGVSGSDLTKEQEENLESIGCSYFRDDGELPSRFVNGVILIQQLDFQFQDFTEKRWGLLESLNGEFIVADCYQGIMLMPISPTLAFCAGYDDMVIDLQTLININKESIDIASDFCFARDWDKCPVA
jgi:hypothetical protein